MLNFTVGKYKRNLPENMQETTVSFFLKSIKPTENNFEFCAELLDIPLDYLRSLPQKTFTEVLYYVMQWQKIFKAELPEIKLQQKYFEFENERYIIPQDLGLVSSGQWFDAMKLLEGREPIIDWYPYALSIFCLKEGEVYNSEVSLARAKRFYEMSVVEVHTIVCFFLKSSYALRTFILHHLGQKPTLNLSEQELKSLIQSIAAMLPLTFWQKIKLLWKVFTGKRNILQTT